jgi:phosphinothricin acetyltransferase
MVKGCSAYMDVKIRDAAEDDLPAILSIYNDVIVNTTAVYSEQPHSLQMRRDWFNDRLNNNFPVFVADVSGAVAGFSSYGHFRVWPCYRYTVEVSVYVEKTNRGKGISKMLLGALLDHARQMNIHAIIAGISADNKISIKLHQSFGFAEVAHFKEVGYKFNRWLDLKFFELMIENTPGLI